MKKSLSFLAASKWGALTIIIAFLASTIFLTSCEEMPDLTPNVWSNNGYTLKMGTSSTSLKAPAPGATATGIVNVPQMFMVSGPDGQGVDGVNFVFSDGTSVIGKIIAHTFTTVGSFTITATLPDATVLTGAINISAVVANPAGEIYLISSNLANGKWTYVIGLPTTYIYNYSATDGWCWVEGTTAGWPTSTLNAYALSTTVTTEGIKYLVYTITRDDGWEELTWGENMNSSGIANWANNTSSQYYKTTATGGTYNIYFQKGHIYNSVPTLVLPGDVGDANAGWITRIKVVNDVAASKYNITLYINNSAITSTGTPQLLYKIDADATFTTVGLVAGTDYYSSPVLTIGYESLVSWKCDPAVTIDYTLSTMYSSSMLALAYQFHTGMK